MLYPAGLQGKIQCDGSPQSQGEASSGVGSMQRGVGKDSAGRVKGVWRPRLVEPQQTLGVRACWAGQACLRAAQRQPERSEECPGAVTCTSMSAPKLNVAERDAYAWLAPSDVVQNDSQMQMDSHVKLLNKLDLPS